MKNSSNRYFYFLSFLEGGSVMACELFSAKLLAPYFGTSLYIWAAVLGLTLGGLTVGYFIGGKLSKTYNQNPKLLYVILILAGVLLALMPFISKFIMDIMSDSSLSVGAIVSLLVYMVPPLSLMGMVSPVIINLVTREASSSGNNAGNVYAISTLGGILFTFIMGFYVIPNFGIKLPSVIVGFLLAIFPLISLILKRESKVLILVTPLLLLSLLSLKSEKEYNDEYQVLYESEGILGQVKVVDHPAYLFTSDNRPGRALIVNNTLQSFASLNENLDYSIWTWSHYYPAAASIFPKGTKVLLLGLGGGTLIKQLQRLDFDVDVVEIDKRIGEVCKTYFGIDPNQEIIIDDARHYIRTSSKTYDIIIYDTFLGESVPEHLLTIEGITDAQRILKPGGMIMSNFYGFIHDEIGYAARSVLKTFEAAKMETNLLATPGEENSRNLIFLASADQLPFETVNYQEGRSDTIKDITPFFLDKELIDLDDAEILEDNKPKLSKLYAKAAMSWKNSYNQYYKTQFSK